MYVVAQANSGVHGFSNYGTAKNSLAVGAIADTGTIASFSSHGPTADGRLAPNVVGTGLSVYSARGSGQNAGYDSLNGTSMASPSVAGVAALLMDAAPRFRGQPALVRARLMASAVKPDPHLRSGSFATDNSSGPGSFQNQYGLGLTSARLSVLQRDRPEGWRSGAAVSDMQDGQYAHVDIDVPGGASRLDIVMTWDEAAADAVTESVLNDLDLWLDVGADCVSPSCGEHSSRSRVDNVEWIVLNQPPPGRHRIKILAERIHGEAPRTAVAWTVIRGASTPQLRVEPTSDVIQLRRGETAEIELSVSVDDYVASATTLHIGHQGSSHNYIVRVDREDGATRSVRLDSNGTVNLGEIGTGEDQRLTLSFATRYSHRIYLTATAWNAIGGTAQVDIQVDDTLLPDDKATPPANDHFADATPISGASGEQLVDLTLATREPGEPEVERNLFLKQANEATAAEEFAKSRSAWFAWQAPATGQYTFRYAATWSRNDVTMAVFEGDRLATLDQIGANPDASIAFNARRGRPYWIRVATTAYYTRASSLSWEGGNGRPPNDDFANRERIDGSEGTVTGNNLGAGQERGEFFGDRAATVWYEWVAPEDGHWTFTTSNGRLLAFTGDSVASLRLVSSIYDYIGYATVVAAAGESYQLAVATRDIDTAGDEFDLLWRPSNPSERSRLTVNDQYAEATVLAGATGRTPALPNEDDVSTVEPGEPYETGTQSKWWRWRAPGSGRYTFRLSGRDADLFEAHLFSGDALAELEWLGGASELVLDSREGETYSIAVGKRYDSTFDRIGLNLILGWGETPANDLRAGATTLSGTNGSVTASHEFATTSAEETTTVAGHSSLWWTWMAPQSGWYRFWIEKQAERAPDREGVLAVYAMDADDKPTLLDTTDRSYVLSGMPETAVLAVAGDRYLIQVAPRALQPAGTSRFAWSRASAPDWLIYRGKLVDGDRLPDGGILSLHEPYSLAMDDAGGTLFVATSEALLLFSRDERSGELSLDRSIAYSDRSGNSLSWLARAALQWVSEQGLLYGFSDDRAALFRLAGTGEGFAEKCAMEAAHGIDGHSIARTLLADGFLYLIGHYGGIAAYRTAGPCEFSLVQALSSGAQDHPLAEQVAALSDIVDATLGQDGNHVHVARARAVSTFERNAQSGALQLTSVIRDGDSADSGVLVEFPTNASRVTSIAMDPSGRRMYVFGLRGPQTMVFDLRRAGAPSFLSYTPHFYMDRLGFQTHFDYPITGWVHSPYPCAASAPRGNDAVDVVCKDSAFVAKWDSAMGGLVVSDWFSLSAPDRFGNEIPQFGNALQALQSPDGAHLYVINADWPHALLTFQRADSIPLP